MSKSPNPFEFTGRAKKTRFYEELCFIDRRDNGLRITVTRWTEAAEGDTLWSVSTRRVLQAMRDPLPKVTDDEWDVLVAMAALIRSTL